MSARRLSAPKDVDTHINDGNTPNKRRRVRKELTPAKALAKAAKSTVVKEVIKRDEEIAAMQAERDEEMAVMQAERDAMIAQLSELKAERDAAIAQSISGKTEEPEIRENTLTQEQMSEACDANIKHKHKVDMKNALAHMFNLNRHVGVQTAKDGLKTGTSLEHLFKLKNKPGKARPTKRSKQIMEKLGSLPLGDVSSSCVNHRDFVRLLLCVVTESGHGKVPFKELRSDLNWALGQWAENMNNVKHFTKVCIETLSVLEKAMTEAFGDNFDVLSEMVLDDSLNETGMVLSVLEPDYFGRYKSPMSDAADASNEQQGEKSPDDELV